MIEITDITEIFELFELDLFERWIIITFFYDGDHVLYDPVQEKVYNCMQTKVIFLHDRIQKENA